MGTRPNNSYWKKRRCRSSYYPTKVNRFPTDIAQAHLFNEPAYNNYYRINDKFVQFSDELNNYPCYAHLNWQADSVKSEGVVSSGGSQSVALIVMVDSSSAFAGSFTTGLGSVICGGAKLQNKYCPY